MFPIHKEQKLMTLAEREALISNHPFFCLLNEDELRKFVLAFKEQRVNAGEIIAEQGSIIDKVYLIVSGTAHVNKAITNIAGKKIISVASLKPGDAIGISSMGIYSNTEFRIAEVKASSAMVLLSIHLNDLYQLVNHEKSPYPALKKSIESILLMHFINQSHLFGHLTQVEMENIALGVKKITVKKGKIIFEEGDKTDSCYFLLKGKVHISTQREETTKMIAELGPHSLFGEGSIYDNGKRNARATAKTDCDLFMMTKEHLSHIKTNTKIKDLLNQQRMKQLRPHKIKNVTLTYQDTPEGQQFVLITDKQDSLVISKLEKAIWEEMDGFNTLLDINLQLQRQYKELTLTSLYHIISRLQKKGFASMSENPCSWPNRVRNFLSSVTNKLNRT